MSDNYKTITEFFGFALDESIIDLLGPLGGLEGSIVATMEGWKGPFWI